MKIFGTTIKETKNAYQQGIDTKIANARIVMSFLLLALAVVMIFYSNDTMPIGEFLLGAIVGYWLK